MSDDPNTPDESRPDFANAWRQRHGQPRDGDPAGAERFGVPEDAARRAPPSPEPAPRRGFFDDAPASSAGDRAPTPPPMDAVREDAGPPSGPPRDAFAPGPKTAAVLAVEDAPRAPSRRAAKTDPFALPADGRRRRRRWPWIVGGIVVGLGLLVLFAPSLVPSGPIRKMAAQKISSALGGRAVTIDGLDFGWWSGVRVRGLTVAGADADAPPLLALDEAEADAKIVPLLSKRVEKFSVAVRGLRANVRPADLALFGQTPPPDAAWALAWTVRSLTAAGPGLDAPIAFQGRLEPGDAAHRLQSEPALSGGFDFDGTAAVLSGTLDNLAFNPNGTAEVKLNAAGVPVAEVLAQLGVDALAVGALDGPVAVRLADGKARIEQLDLAVSGAALAAGAPALPRVAVSAVASYDLANDVATLERVRLDAGEGEEALLTFDADRPLTVPLAALARGVYLDGAWSFRGLAHGARALDFLVAQGWMDAPPVADLRAEIPLTGLLHQNAPAGGRPGALELVVDVDQDTAPVSATLTEASGAPGRVEVDLNGRRVTARLPVGPAGPDPEALTVELDLARFAATHTAAGGAAVSRVENRRGGVSFQAGRLAAPARYERLSEAGAPLREEALAQGADRLSVDLDLLATLPAGNPFTRDAATFAVAPKMRYNLGGGWLEVDRFAFGEPGQPPILASPAFSGVLRTDVDAPAVRAALGTAAGAAPVYAEFAAHRHTLRFDLPRLEALLRPELLAGFGDLRGLATVDVWLEALPERLLVRTAAYLDDVAATAARPGEAPRAVHVPPPAANQRNQVHATVEYAWAGGTVRLRPLGPNQANVFVGPLALRLDGAEFAPATGALTGVRYQGSFNPAAAADLFASFGVPFPAGLFAGTIQFGGGFDFDGTRLTFAAPSYVAGQIAGGTDPAKPEQFQLFHAVDVALPTDKDPAFAVTIPPAADGRDSVYFDLRGGDGAASVTAIPGTVRIDPARGLPEGAVDLAVKLNFPTLRPYARLAARGQSAWQRLDANVFAVYDAAVRADLGLKVDADGGVTVRPNRGAVAVARPASGNAARQTVFTASLASGESGDWHIAPDGAVTGQSRLGAEGDLLAFWWFVNAAAAGLPDASFAPPPAAAAGDAAVAAWQANVGAARAALLAELASWRMSGQFRADVRLAAPSADRPITLAAMANLLQGTVYYTPVDPATSRPAGPNKLMYNDPRLYAQVQLAFDPKTGAVDVSQAQLGLVGPNPAASILALSLARPDAPLAYRPADGRAALSARPLFQLGDAAAVQAALPGWLGPPMRLQGGLRAQAAVALDGDTLRVADGRLEAPGFVYRAGDEAMALSLRLANAQAPATFQATVDLAPPKVAVANPDFAALASMNVSDAALAWPELEMAMDGRGYRLKNGTVRLGLRGGILELGNLRVEATPTAAAAAAAGAARLAAAGRADFTQANPVLDFNVGAANLPVPELVAGLLPTEAKVESGILNVPADAQKTLHFWAAGLTPEALLGTLQLQNADFRIDTLSVIAQLPADTDLSAIEKPLKLLQKLESAGSIAETLSGNPADILGNLANRRGGADDATGATGGLSALTGGGGADALLFSIMRLDPNRQRRVRFVSVTGGFTADGRGNVGIDPNNPIRLAGDDDMADLYVKGQIRGAGAKSLMDSPIAFTVEVRGKLNKLFDYDAIVNLILSAVPDKHMGNVSRESLRTAVADAMDKSKTLSFPVSGTLGKPNIIGGVQHFLAELLEQTFNAILPQIIKDLAKDKITDAIGGDSRLGDLLNKLQPDGADKAAGGDTGTDAGAGRRSEGDRLREGLGNLLRRDK